MVIVLLLCAGGAGGVLASSAKKAKKKAVGSAPSMAMIHNCASCHSLSIKEANEIFKGLGDVKAVKDVSCQGAV